MKTISQLEAEKQKIEEQIKKLQEEENSKDFIEADNGKVRIYKWDKPIKDFPMPKGFEMAEFMDLVNLYDNGFELDKDEYYFTKHFSKKQQKKEYCLSRLFLYWDLNLVSGNIDLANSSDYGRVVVVRKGGNGE